MKNLRLLFVSTVTVIAFIGCSENDPLIVDPVADNSMESSALKSAKPAAHLIGVANLQINLEGVPPDDPTWIGSIDFEGYGTFGIRYFHLSPFRDYSQASPFEEWWEVYTLDADETVVMAGPDAGVLTLANKPYGPCPGRMNGKIEVASGSFEPWLGRNVHMSGWVTFQELGLPDGTTIMIPICGPLAFRVN